jgi:phosphoadenosine phosphosulfate reductase
MLIESARHTSRDLELWAELETCDRLHATSARHSKRVAESLDALRSFMSRPCYVGVSWGKDSVVTAHLALSVRADVPMCWIRVEPIANPECVKVRDVFLSRYPRANYHEYEVRCRRDRFGWHASGTLEAGIAMSEDQFGIRRVLGIRGDESTGRSIRVKRWGLSSKNACAPLGRWSIGDVMSYLAMENLPVHPAYAMLGGGRWPRDRIRVASLGGRRGDGCGRFEWEQEYYGDVLRRIERDTLGVRASIR